MPTPTLPLEHATAAEPEPAGDVVVFDDVHLSFDRGPVLDGISFRLARGETKAIFGVAGAGKSTILKLALGLLKPDSGRILVLGEDVTAMREEDLFELRRKIGIVFQESALFDSLTVRDNVAFRLMEEGGDFRGRDRPPSPRGAELRRAGAPGRHASLGAFGSIRRRVAIARAIITQPSCCFSIHPTGDLDPVTSTTIIELIVKQRDVYKTSSLLVTHRLQDAFTMATHYFDRKTNHMQPLPPGGHTEVPIDFLVLRDGKVIFDGDSHQLAETKDEYIREYIS